MFEGHMPPSCCHQGTPMVIGRNRTETRLYCAVHVGRDITACIYTTV